jgi:hypothetical protein
MDVNVRTGMSSGIFSVMPAHGCGYMSLVFCYISEVMHVSVIDVCVYVCVCGLYTAKC